MTGVLIWLSGADPDILQRTRDRARYVGIGSAVLITSVIAALSMTFALHTALRINLPGAVFCAVLWGLAIMSIDRWLVVSLQRHERKLVYALLVLVRLSLGLLFGFIISTPVVLQVFSPEINKEIQLIQTRAENVYLTGQKHSSLEKKILADQRLVSALHQTINDNGGTAPNPYQSPQVKTLISQRNAAQAQETKDYKEWQCQLYNIPRGCKAGNGPLAKASHAAYLRDKAQVSQLNQQIKAQVHEIRSTFSTSRTKRVAQARAQIGEAEARLKADQAEQSNLLNGFEKQNSNTAGLLLRLKALGEVTGDNGALRLARWLLFALFTTIECLPILVKTLLNLGPESDYEKLLELENAKTLRIEKETIKRETVAELIQLDDIIPQANRLAEERRRRYPRIRAEILAAEDDIAVRTVRGWWAHEERFASNAGALRRAWRALRLAIAGLMARITSLPDRSQREASG